MFGTNFILALDNTVMYFGIGEWGVGSGGSGILD